MKCTNKVIVMNLRCDCDTPDDLLDLARCSGEATAIGVAVADEFGSFFARAMDMT